MYINFTLEENTKTFEEMLNEGLTFTQINKELKEQTKNTKTFEDFLNGMPALNCMFKEYLEDEVAGDIYDIASFITAYEDYFYCCGWIESEKIENGGHLTEEEAFNDLNEIETYIMYNWKELAETLDII